MMDFFRQLFGSNDFMPHGHCYLWQPEVMWLHALSDGIIALAYATIPISLGWLAWRRRDIQLNWMIWSFGVFILACGATHVMEIVNIWIPTYWLAGMIKAVTALASIATAIALVRLLPTFLAIPSLDALATANTRLSREVQSQNRMREELKAANEALETRVAERTAELVAANLSLTAEIASREQAGNALTAQVMRLKLLHQITQATGERQDMRSIFQVVIRNVEDHLPLDFGCVCLYEPGGESLVVTCVGVKSREMAEAMAMSELAAIDIDQNGLSRCVQGHLVHEPEVGTLSFSFLQRLHQVGLGSMVFAPLRVENRVFGVLMAGRRAAHSFSSGECEFLRQLSEQVALAAHQTQLHQALQRAYDDLRQTQQAVMLQERLRALGQMASGVAHDINNALTPVTLYTHYLLEREPGLSTRARGYLETISRAVGDIASTIGRMRESYRQREAQEEAVTLSLNELIVQVIDLTRARWHDMPQKRGVVISVVSHLAANTPAILGVANELRDALTNLIFNAVDAMPEGGTITLSSSLMEGSTPLVQVAISDTGTGMSEETRRRCLELFFTTKGERGTGLGLAMVYGTVQRHGAEIDIVSRLGIGTTVRLTFPVATATSVASIAKHAAASRQLHILVVDDDPLLLASVAEVLSMDGHSVVTADGGEAGIRAFQAALASPTPFTVVITDLGMPYVDGRRVANAVKAASPSTPVILLTGWGQRLVAEGDLPASVDRVLSKPPKPQDLRLALAEVCQPC
jgi:signal transduction histidine kinase/ActR/RegA family two-component response regulator